MPLTIFCPASHLILDAARCAQCGWERPAPGEIGQPAWGPVSLGVELGGPGRHVFAQPAVLGGIAAFPLGNHEIVGLGLTDGKERWRTSPPEGLMTRNLVVNRGTFLASLSDDRPIGLAGSGQLVSLDPVSGHVLPLWQADGHQLSAPLVMNNQIFLRTSTSELIALQNSPKVKLQWRIPLDTWWALPLHAADGLVLFCDGNAMQGQGRLIAVRMEDGARVWSHTTHGMLTQPPASLNGFVIFQDGRKQVTALDLQTGKQAWEQKINHIYTAPVESDTSFVFAMRGSTKKEDKGYYLLRAVDPASGQVRWEAPLPARVLIPPVWHENRIYLGSEAGRLFVYSERDGTLLLDQALTGEDDPLRTELVISDGLLMTGSYEGNILAVRIGAPREEIESPKAYLDKG